MAAMSTRAPGAVSAGASVSIRMCNDNSIRPRPIETRPMSLIRERGPLRNATRPRTNRTGARAATLNDRACTISVVPTFAPSMIARAGTRSTRPSAASELVIRAVAVLLWRRAVSPVPAAKAAKRFFSALAKNHRKSGPKARMIPLWTMCSPHNSSATPPNRSSRISFPSSSVPDRVAAPRKLTSIGNGSTYLVCSEVVSGPDTDPEFRPGCQSLPRLQRAGAGATG